MKRAIRRTYEKPFLEMYIDKEINNYYKSAEKENSELPIYKEIKMLLPKPILENGDEVIRCYEKTWEIAFNNLRKCKKDSPFVNNFIDTAFNNHLFMWDSAFIVQFGKYGDHVFKFQNTLNNLYATQEEDGFIGRELNQETGQNRFHRFDPVSTGPNILAWAEMNYYEQFLDIERLEHVFPILVEYHRWLKMNRTWKDGSYFSCGWASGMDNQLRANSEELDASFHDYKTWVDTCMQQVLSAKCLKKMAEILNRESEIEDIIREEKVLTTYINEKLWDEQSKFYYDSCNDGSLDRRKTIGSYWALIAEIVPDVRIERFVEHLTDEKEFGTKHPIPSIPKSNPSFNESGQYWRGGVWAPTNYMVFEGLVRNGYGELAHELAKKHLQYVVGVYSKTETVWENYCPNIMEPGTPAKPNFVGWTGVSVINVLFEHVMGIRFEQGGLIWCVRLLEEHGIEGYYLGQGKYVTLRCERRNEQNEKPKIDFIGNSNMTVTVVWGNNQKFIQECTTIEKA